MNDKFITLNAAEAQSLLNLITVKAEDYVSTHLSKADHSVPQGFNEISNLIHISDKCKALIEAVRGEEMNLAREQEESSKMEQSKAENPEIVDIEAVPVPEADDDPKSNGKNHKKGA